MILSLFHLLSIFNPNGLIIDTFLPSYNFSLQHNISNLPPCNSVIYFENDMHSYSSCKWVNPTHISTSILRKSKNSQIDTYSQVDINDMVFINKSTILFTNLEEKYETMIQPNENPLIPNVIISAPSQITNCNSFNIDVTSSTNNLFRKWKSATLLISSDFFSTFINNHDVSKPLTIPANYLTSGLHYKFTYTLCNFMNACNSASHDILVTDKIIPIVSILGSNKVSIFASQSITLNTIAYLQPCNNVKSSKNLIFNWTLYSNSIYKINTISDFLYLPPYYFPILNNNYKIFL